MQHLSRVTRSIRPSFLHRQPFSSTTRAKQVWKPGPAPPRLPKEEQEIFEKLQQQSTGAFSTPRPAPGHPESDAEAAANSSSSEGNSNGNGGVENVASSKSEADQMLEMLRERARVVAKGDGEELHPNVRRGAPPEFEGDTNPKTGEVGGPKNEPLRWGVAGDWSYNGRVTDF